jgi:hypothetical protein
MHITVLPLVGVSRFFSSEEMLVTAGGATGTQHVYFSGIANGGKNILGP